MKPAGKTLLYLRALRLPFLSASLTPVLLGTAYAWWRAEMFNAELLSWALLGTALINLAANTANDYFDHLSGTDARNMEFISPFTGGSRLIQEGLLSPREVLALCVVCALGAVLTGGYLILRAGFPVLVLGVLGLGMGIFYTAPPLRLASRGLGEPVIAVAVGILPVVGSYYVQTRRMSGAAAAFAVPVAFLVTAIILINEFPDAAADASSGRRTWVVRFGARTAMLIYAFLMTCWALALIACVAAGLCPGWALIALVTLVGAIPAVALAAKRIGEPRRLRPAIVLTIVTHLLTGLLMSAACIIAAHGKM